MDNKFLAALGVYGLFCIAALYVYWKYCKDTRAEMAIINAAYLAKVEGAFTSMAAKEKEAGSA